MITKTLPLGWWRPDLPDFTNKGITATNVIPWKNSYKSFPSMVVYSSALTAKCQGAYFTRDSAANVYNFAGDTTKLYKLASTGTYTDASRLAGGVYATAVDDWWEFATWGQTVIATNFTDVPQVITLGGGNFTALGGSPPQSRHVAVIKDFVVMGNVHYGGISYPNQVYWSGLNNSVGWTIGTNQSDTQDLQGDGGWIQKIVAGEYGGGEFGLVFQERQIWRMSYVGTPLIFQFDLIERSRGAFCPQGTIGWGNMVFFIADDGFYVIIGGGAAQPIGDGKVDKFFLNNLKVSQNYLVDAIVDPVNKLVMWGWPSNNATSNLRDKILIYNWTVGEWALANVVTECFTRFASPGNTLESLDAISGSLDALSPSLDSRTWTGGAQSLAGFDSTHKLNTFSGTAMSGTVDTGEQLLHPTRHTMAMYYTPLVDGNAASVTPKSRDRLADSVTIGNPIAQNSVGDCPSRVLGRFHSARVNTTGSFNFIQGVEIGYSIEGER